MPVIGRLPLTRDRYNLQIIKAGRFRMARAQIARGFIKK